MVNGRISEVGTYRELLDRKGAFAEFLYTYLETEDKGDEADEGAMFSIIQTAFYESFSSRFSSSCGVASLSKHGLLFLLFQICR